MNKVYSLLQTSETSTKVSEMRIGRLQTTIKRHATWLIPNKIAV